MHQGHNKAADYWGFGVFIFEMLAGAAPFESKSESERYNKVLRGQVAFPEDFNLQVSGKLPFGDGCER